MGSVQWLRNGIRKKNRAEREKHNQVESREFSFSSAIQGLLNYVPTCVKVNRLSEAELRSEISWGIVWSSETSRSFAMWWDERAIPRRCHQNINLCDCLPQKGTNEKASGQKVRRIHRLHKSTESDDVWLISHFLLSHLFVTAVNERIGFDTMVIHQHQIACHCLNKALLKCDFYYLI